MALYDVYRADGSITRGVEAASKSEASKKVRYAGESIKKVVEVTGTTPTPPITETITDETPAITTGGTTTGETTATGGATGGIMWQRIQDKIAQGIPLDRFEQAYVDSNLSKPGGTTTYTDQEQADYDNYLLLIDLYKEFGVSLPMPKDIADYLANADEWARMLATGEGTQGYTISDVTRGYTPDQLREYKQFLIYQSVAEAGDWKPTGISDFLTNYDKSQEMLAKWKPIYEQEFAEREEYEQYQEEQREHALDPEEAARRREEGYGEGRVAAGERYRETPEYFDPFTKWMNQQKAMSGAFTGFVEDKYQSLRSEYKGGLPPLTGFPTPAAARAEAEKREAGLQAWLPGQVPGLYQEYMGQPAYQRGERLGEYSPTMRTTNW